jgi:hypothetical protein
MLIAFDPCEKLLERDYQDSVFTLSGSVCNGVAGVEVKVAIFDVCGLISWGLLPF